MRQAVVVGHVILLACFQIFNSKFYLFCKKISK